MSKKQVEGTQQGKELLAIQELSQQLQTYFKDIQHLRRENFLFQSYTTRLQSQYKKNQQQEKRKPRDRRNQQKKVSTGLTPQEKYQIAQQQAQALKQLIQTARVRSDAIIQTLRALMEETDMAIAQIRKDAYDFQRQILMGGQNSRTGHIEAQRIQKFFEDKERHKNILIQKYKSKKNTLATQIMKTMNQIAKKQEMGDQLKFIDFHQLQIQNKKYVKEIEQKNERLLKFKVRSGEIAAQLLQTKKKLNQIVNQITKYQKDIAEKEKLIIQLTANKETQSQTIEKQNTKKSLLTTQADQLKSPNNTTDIPDTMAYVLQKRKQQKLLYEKKNLQRKILIANPLYQKAKKALGI